MHSRTTPFYEPSCLKDPYPGQGRRRIRDFSYDSDLYLLRLSGGVTGIPREAQYILAEPYKVSFRLDTEEQRRSITVPKGMLTDLVSVPRCFRSIVGRVGSHLEAAIIHDFLYVAWQDLNVSPADHMRRFADQMMFAAMQAAGMWCKASVIYCAVRVGGRRGFYRRERERYVDLERI